MTATTACRMTWADETLELLPQRAVHWPARRTVIIADVHVGKTASFRRAGVPVPHGVTTADTTRLDAVLAVTGAERLVILGDLLHDARGRREVETMDAFRAWRDRHRTLDVLLVRGNHDARAGDPPEDWRIRCVDEPFDDDGVALCHDPARAVPGTPSFGGHLHPAVVLRDKPRGRLRCACFHFTRSVVTLPAFGSFTGGHVIRPARGDRVFVVGPDAVVEVTPSAARIEQS